MYWFEDRNSRLTDVSISSVEDAKSLSIAFIDTATFHFSY